MKFENLILDRTGNENQIKENLLHFDQNMMQVEANEEEIQYDPASFHNT